MSLKLKQALIGILGYAFVVALLAMLFMLLVRPWQVATWLISFWP